MCLKLLLHMIRVLQISQALRPANPSVSFADSSPFRGAKSPAGEIKAS